MAEYSHLTFWVLSISENFSFNLDDKSIKYKYTEINGNSSTSREIEQASSLRLRVTFDSRKETSVNY